ncbi:SsrA-binding protein SmpB [uncultured Tessaracoccus sp.]|uniref:SsrA-binding protein SmpB n=1 Tax=uncultured Tessaracoccus sp. TaxID=905023 RepID=UPI0025F2C94A|nr:SsrA-binding protein SmpB [uncultured Tessaracoccus sp.]
MPKQTGQTMIAQNKKARHDYSIGETFEAGLVLTGTEVKSLRHGRATIGDAYATVEGGEAWLINANIPEYTYGSWRGSHSARRTRKLLLHAKEIARLSRALESSGTTLVPLSMYFKEGRAKVEIAVATGKKEWDKRRTIKERELDREARRAMAQRNRYRH